MNTKAVDNHLDVIRNEFAATRKSSCALLGLAKNQLADMCAELGIETARITGRTKSWPACRKKLRVMVPGTLGASGGACAAFDKIGIRVIVTDMRDLRKLVRRLRRGMILCKDYVSMPRRDGEILGGDSDDVYRGYHLYTRRLIGVPVEIQLFTKEMRQSGIALKRKYGDNYWKTNAFRARRTELGDMR